jgi:hypothetical protein
VKFAKKKVFPFFAKKNYCKEQIIFPKLLPLSIERYFLQGKEYYEKFIFYAVDYTKIIQFIVILSFILLERCLYIL